MTTHDMPGVPAGTFDQIADSLLEEVPVIGSGSAAAGDGLSTGLRCWLVRCGSPMYQRVIAFAAQRYGIDHEQVVTAEDSWSDVLAFVRGGELVATITMTLDRDGPIEAREHYPEVLFEKFGAGIGTLFRLAVARGSHGLGFVAMRTAAARGIGRGLRLALVSAKPTMLRWYLASGFVPLTTQPYTHPRLGTSHVPLFVSADPTRPLTADLCDDIGDPLCHGTVAAALCAREGAQ